MRRIEGALSDSQIRDRIEQAWRQVSSAFEDAAAKLVTPWMARTELSFHEHVKLLGYICLLSDLVEGDIVEIGVWKGKSLAFMRILAGENCRIVGIDPCANPGQSEEIDYYHRLVYPNSSIVKSPSELAIAKVAGLTRQVKLLHIDGGHAAHNVWMDFLIYDHLIVPGGYVVFDDYGDSQDSPEVRDAVDRLNSLGFFDRYDVVGQLPGFENSFILFRKES